MASPRYRRRCGICSGTLKKNGTTSAGKTRYRCTTCGASSTAQRQGPSRQAQITTFVSWLLGTTSRHAAGITRAQRRALDWCWNVDVPRPVVTGEVYSTLMIDGTYFASWCLLVAYNTHHVVAWQWASRENTAAYQALLAGLAPPDIVLTDGHRGSLAALAQTWPHTPVQRCLFHVYQRVIHLVTRHPRTQAGKEILALTRMLMNITTPAQAAAWLMEYYQWEQRWQVMLKERTHLGNRGTSITDTRRSWWTHPNLRSVRRTYRSLIKTGTLFAYLAPLEKNPQAEPLAKTTSPLEGGINAGIKRVLSLHRGLSAEHARRAVEWYLNSKTEFPADPASLITPAHWKPQRATKQTHTEPDGPVTYDTHYNAAAPWEDGIWIRKGWAGRSRN